MSLHLSGSMFTKGAIKDQDRKETWISCRNDRSTLAKPKMSGTLTTATMIHLPAVSDIFPITILYSTMSWLILDLGKRAVRQGTRIGLGRVKGPVQQVRLKTPIRLLTDNLIQLHSTVSYHIIVIRMLSRPIYRLLCRLRRSGLLYHE